LLLAAVVAVSGGVVNVSPKKVNVPSVPLVNVKKPVNEKAASLGRSVLTRFYNANPVYPYLASPVCNFCQYVVTDVQKAFSETATDFISDGVADYFKSLCDVAFASNPDAVEDGLLALCDKAVSSGVAQAIGIWKQTFPIFSANQVCQSLGWCKVPSCPVGFTQGKLTPSLCTSNNLAWADVYPAVAANCSTFAAGSHLCTLGEASSLSGAELIAIATAANAAITWSPPAGDSMAVAWLQTTAKYRALVDHTYGATGQDPRVLVGFEDWKSNPLFQVGISLADYQVGVYPWSQFDDVSSATLPYSLPSTSSVPALNGPMLGFGLCCAPLQQ